ELYNLQEPARYPSALSGLLCLYRAGGKASGEPGFQPREPLAARPEVHRHRKQVVHLRYDATVHREVERLDVAPARLAGFDAHRGVGLGPERWQPGRAFLPAARATNPAEAPLPAPARAAEPTTRAVCFGFGPSGGDPGKTAARRAAARRERSAGATPEPREDLGVRPEERAREVILGTARLAVPPGEEPTAGDDTRVARTRPRLVGEARRPLERREIEQRIEAVEEAVG